ncbi:N-acetylmuramoyl-L-alanine amidase family protein [Ruania zhangjianzhongii]|uniref:N-acetylmuramoyl-L-alanine amidase family protein n=1 Tax=Ruania zhangjianzhongii TaxID=2603206 RepID=UPI0011CB6222|nr:N-acetylmuramoyl-L-alanine amidase [Ruania zhangjianzhongii]
MRQRIHRLAGAAALAVGASLALAPAASADFSPYVPFPEGKDPGVSLAAQPLIGVRIAVDPGHNGGRADDPEAANRPVADGREGRTACGSTGSASVDGYAEHEFAFEVSEQLTADLETLGASVSMTRTDDDGIGPCVDRRGTFAEDQDVDLMVSIHAASAEDEDAPGFAVVVADPPLSSSQREPSRELAEELVDALEDGGFTPNDELEDPIVERSDDATLNFARRPAVLLELGELRNSGDAEVMRSEDGQQRYVEAVTAGVIAWVHENR